MTRPAFDYSLDFEAADFRRRPDLYRIGRGEQGVLLVEPYKGEILPHWRFKTAAEARRSSARIYKMFLAYLKAEDFHGADMARKFLQMGWTRARRYANHRGGRKYDKATGAELPRAEDAGKAAAAGVFYGRYVAARRHPEYLDLTGSGVETVGHLRENGRLTVMFCAFEGRPRILRLYGRGRAVEPADPEWAALSAGLPPLPGVRSVVVLEVERIADSCGYGVPLYEFAGDRAQLAGWCEKKGAEGIREYQARKNRTSIDGLPGLRSAIGD